MLPDRRYLVALGEAGVAVLDARGKVKQRYAIAAFKLVLADSGQVALAIAPRERMSRVTRLDLVSHACTDLGVIALQHAAPHYNGIGWSVVVDKRILVLDTSKGLHEVLWHVADLPGPVVKAGFFHDYEIYLIQGPHGIQDWGYHVPTRRLQARSEVAIHNDLPVIAHRLGHIQQPQIHTNTHSHLEFDYYYAGKKRRCVLHKDGSESEFAFDFSTFIPVALGMVVGLHQATGSRYFVIRFTDGACVATLDWPPGAVMSVREQPGHLLFHDSQGRLLDLQVENSALRCVSFF